MIKMLVAVFLDRRFYSLQGKSSPRAAVALALLSAVGAASCSLIKLSDEVGRAQCNASSECSVLTIPKGYNECFSWQCSGKPGYCALLPVDDDNDHHAPAYVKKTGCSEAADSGAADAACEGDGKACSNCMISCKEAIESKGFTTKADDCNDNAASIYTGANESCDGKDNNCDGVTDEDVLDTDPSSGKTVLNFPVSSGKRGAYSLGYALDPQDSSIAIAFSMDAVDPATGKPALAQPGVAVLSNLVSALTAQALAITFPGGEIGSVVTEDMGITALGDGRFAVAFINKSGQRKNVVAGLLDAASPTKLKIDKDVFDKGLSCASGEDCSTQTPATFTPALGALDDGRVLVAYVRGNSTDRQQQGCGKLSQAQDAPANLMRNNQGTLQEKSTSAVSLGKTKDLSPPVVAGIAAIVTGQEAFGFLAILSDENGDIVLKKVKPAPDGVSLEISELYKISGNGEPQGDVSVALGPVSHGVQSLAVAFRRGCAPNARIWAQLFDLAQDANGMYSLTAGSQAAEIGTEKSGRSPSPVYSAMHKTWIVVYATGQGELQARLMDEQGKVRDESPYTLFEPAAGGAEILYAPLAVKPTATDVWVNALAYTRTKTASGETYAIERFGLGCY